MSSLPLPAADRFGRNRTSPPNIGRVTWLARRRELLLGLTGIVFVLLLWQISAWTKFIDPTFSSSPVKAISSLWQQLFGGAPSLWPAIGETMETIGIGMGISLAVGLPLGLIIGRASVLRELVDPWISIFNAVPYVVFLPIIIFWFGIGETSEVVLVVWSALFPLLINAVAAARNLDRHYLAVSRVFCASRTKTLRAIVFPATLPYLLAGVRQAIGRGLVGAIVAELFMGSSGLGFVVQRQTSNFQMDAAMGAIIAIAIIAVLLTRAIGLLERHYTHWSEA
jgi:ABC-type nitrate/sulfonate/bicarbonate transport system permease component